MRPFILCYWGLAYTGGIACTTILAIRFLSDRERTRGRLLVFLLSVDLAVLALALRDCLAPEGGRLLGTLALIGASLTTATFPRYALLFDQTARRRRFSNAACGLAAVLAACNAASLVTTGVFGLVAGTCTFLALISALYLGLSWISRSRTRTAGSADGRLGMVLFFFLTGAVILLDFLGLLGLAIPALEGHYVLFPGCFLFLSAFLFRANVRPWPAPARGAAAASEASRARYGISRREAEVLALIAKGRTYREIADELFVSLPTIKSHLAHLYDKTGARNKVELLNLFR